ncbi:unnamed protein product [Eruca vesicaria subsp. sativa]|uniref:Uncharacterized protein n=1 Tax=Eruca vesicaria subsp. sativa TaxID=29727 RepID=A0ABC8L7I4_ERUVS|nr:unnamed protein product [Eruca vesicaria subsp. sativa]
MSQSSLLIRKGGPSNGDRQTLHSEGYNSRNPRKRSRSPPIGRHFSPSTTSRYSDLIHEEKRKKHMTPSHQTREARAIEPQTRDRKSSSRQDNRYPYQNRGKEVWSRLKIPSRKGESQRGCSSNHHTRNSSRNGESRPSYIPSIEWRPRHNIEEPRNRSTNHVSPRQEENDRTERYQATFYSQKTITNNRASLESGEIVETRRTEAANAFTEEETENPSRKPSDAPHPPRQEKRYDPPLLKQGDGNFELENSLEQGLEVPITDLESAEVDNLILETERLEMIEKMLAENKIDETMIDFDNDDLLDESPDLDAEKIEAISTLSSKCCVQESSILEPALGTRKGTRIPPAPHAEELGRRLCPQNLTEKEDHPVSRHKRSKRFKEVASAQQPSLPKEEDSTG